jgi:hypothetical protein
MAAGSSRFAPEPLICLCCRVRTVICVLMFACCQTDNRGGVTVVVMRVHSGLRIDLHAAFQMAKAVLSHVHHTCITPVSHLTSHLQHTCLTPDITPASHLTSRLHHTCSACRILLCCFLHLRCPWAYSALQQRLLWHRTWQVRGRVAGRECTNE